MHRWSKRQLLGWLATFISTAIATFWAFWGIIENFHEGWFHQSLFLNLGLMLVQYLSPVIILVSLTVLAIAFPRLGGILHAVVAITLFLVLFDLKDKVAMLLIITPMLLLGTSYWFGRPEPRRVAFFLVLGVPALTLVIFGIEPAVRIAGRVDDGNLQSRVVDGNGIRLVWAGEGVGWPREGVNWHEALNLCRHLSEDGKALAETPQDVWHLPTVEEAVRSMARHGTNSVGLWDPQTKSATYKVRPDKESPLWTTHSQVIYWWTASEVDDKRAYIIVYDGKVWPRNKNFAPAYLAYRCVRPASQYSLAE